MCYQSDGKLMEVYDTRCQNNVLKKEEDFNWVKQKFF